MTVLQAISIINRRAKTLTKLFGAHSEIFEKFSTELTNYEIFTNKKGVLQLRKNAANRSMYRQLTAFAKRIQKTPYAVLKRKADKFRAMFENDDFFDGTGGDDSGKFANIDVYNKWLADCIDYFDSCYNIASLENADNIYSRADYLFNNRNEYISAWNNLYKQGAFSEYEKQYNTEQFEQEYTIDEETGEAIPKNNFYRGL